MVAKDTRYFNSNNKNTWLVDLLGKNMPSHKGEKAICVKGSVLMIHLKKNLIFAEIPYTGVAAGLLLGLVLVGASFLGLFKVPDGVLYDHLSSWSLPSDHEPATVLLLEVEPELHDAGDDVWITLLDQLQQHGAAQIVFSFMPQAATHNFYQRAAQTDNLIFARHMASPHHINATAEALEPLPEAAREWHLNIAMHGMAASEYGVHRRQAHAFFNDQGQATPSFEAMAAGKSNGLLSAELDGSPFLVNMLGGVANLPHIAAARVLNGELISELVTGRTVLIGFTQPDQQTLFTPAAVSGQLLSDLAFHGLALDSLLRDRAIAPLPLWMELPAILLLLGISLFLLQWVGLHYATAVTAALLVVHLVLAWLLLHLFLLWLPLAELWVTQIISLLFFIRHRALHEEILLHQMLRKTNAQLRERFPPTTFSASTEHWSQVITMVTQTLNLRRAIFLERVENDHRLREVKSLHCQLDDISEVRRDYERAPYSTALAKGGVIEVENYLTIAAEDEIQFLAPLLFAGELFGFWAFSIQPENLSALHNREAVLKNFSDQVAELLFHRQQAQQNKSRLMNPVTRYLRLQGGDQFSESLAKTLTVMDRRLIGLEHYLDGIQSAGILYDLFGQVQVVNHQMEQLLFEANHLPYKMTAVDFISAMAGITLEEARALMQSIIFQQQKIALPSNISNEKHSYVLHLAPLLAGKEGRGINNAEPVPFDVEGILCELIDVTVVKRLCNLKEEVASRLSYQVRNDMESLMTGLSLLEAADLPDAKRSRVVNIVRNKIVNLVEITEQTNSLLSQDIDASSAIECYPVDSKLPLRSAIEASKTRSAIYGYQYDIKLPELISLVYASPDGLQLVAESILDLLTGDSVQQGVIRITLKEQKGWIIYRFSNQGFGIPDARFQACLHGDEAALVSDAFKKLRQSVLQVEQWDGKLVGRSEMGVGTKMELKLRGFI